MTRLPSTESLASQLTQDQEIKMNLLYQNQQLILIYIPLGLQIWFLMLIQEFTIVAVMI